MNINKGIIALLSLACLCNTTSCDSEILAELNSESGGLSVEVCGCTLHPADEEHRRDGYLQDDASLSPYRTFSELMEGIDTLRSSAHVVDVLSVFVQDRSIDEDAREKARKLLPRWKQQAARGEEKHGLVWVTPAELKDMKDAAADRLEVARQLREVEKVDDFLAEMKRISNIDKTDFRADFDLGLYWSIVRCDAKEAKKHFFNAVRRLEVYRSETQGQMRINYAAALTNLALTEIRLGELRQAFVHLQEATQLVPHHPIVRHNVALAHSITHTSELISSPKLFHENLSQLLADFEVDATDVIDSVRWAYLPYYEVASENQDQPNSSAQDRFVTGRGTAFAVGRRLWLSERQLVDGQSEVELTFGDGKSEWAKVVDVDFDADVALLQTDRAIDTPFKLELEPTDGQSELSLIQFMFDASEVERVIERPVKSVRTKPFGESLEVSEAKQIECDGAPILNKETQVVGFYTSHVRLIPSRPIGHMIPAEGLQDLIQQHDLDNDGDFGKRGAEVGPAVAGVIVYASPAGAVTDKVTVRKSHYEDHWCMICHGADRISCPAKGCNRGGLTISEPYTVNSVRGPVILYRSKRVPCKHCDGKGYVGCPSKYCSDGKW